MAWHGRQHFFLEVEAYLIEEFDLLNNGDSMEHLHPP
jgi:hypothetical protein